MKNPEDYLEQFDRCLVNEPAWCKAACPFKLDIPEMADKIGKGAVLAAYRAYRSAVAFPIVVSNLCPQPCRDVCPLGEDGEAIELARLERAMTMLGGDSPPNSYNLPPRNKRIAVVGAGLSGLGCALRLAERKYEVEVFEASGRIGGRLNELTDGEVFIADIERQFRFEAYELHLNHRVSSREEINVRGFDAVYVATGRGGEGFGLPGSPEYCLKDSRVISADGDFEDNVLSGRAGLGAGHEPGETAWFAGGGLIGNESVFGLADGLKMGNVMEAWLKTGKLGNPKEEPNSTRICLHPMKGFVMNPDGGAGAAEQDGKTDDGVIMEASGIDGGAGAAEPDGKTDGGEIMEDLAEWAKAEARRCVKCKCDACRLFCDLTAFYNKWPLRIKDEVLATTFPGKAEVKATPAKRLLSTCNQCGVCGEVCPEHIDLGGFILAGRRSMHRQEKAPWAFHDFWLRDMGFSDGDARLLLPGAAEGGYAFFPGCQLGASMPGLVRRVYSALRAHGEAMGMLLRCCGAPAEWSGDEELHRAALSSIAADWEYLGRPTLLAACPTCMKMFAAYLPEIPLMSLYEYLSKDYPPAPSLTDRANTGAPHLPTQESPPQSPVIPNGPAAPQPWAVFDPCSTRGNAPLQAAVRDLARSRNIPLAPLPIQGQLPRCCGYGGQPAIANPPYAGFVAERRISESPLPYLTYCINCRDIFIKAGKEARHILEVLFPDDNVIPGAPPDCLPGVTERRENRLRLKRSLSLEYLNEEPQMEKSTDPKIELVIPEAIKKKMDEERILEEEARLVVQNSESTGRKVIRGDRITRSAYLQIGHMTYWADYRPGEKEGQWLLDNIYCHRMSIELEPVWGGVKREEQP